jgi:prepilin-type N-terminal cleavage/methylation domain-containing protein
VTQSFSGEQPFRSVSARSAGFTLIEILIVLAVIATLTAIAYPFYNSYIDKAKVTVGISTLETVRKTLEDFRIDNGTYPATIDMATGKDDLGRTVLPAALLAEFKSNLFSRESYVATTTDYTLTARAVDSKHSLLVLTPGQVVTQGP